MTGHTTVPIVKRDMSAGRVVGAKNLPHQNEEVVDSTGCQSRLDRCSSVAFTKMIVEYVRVTHTITIYRPASLDRLASICSPLSDSPPV